MWGAELTLANRLEPKEFWVGCRVAEDEANKDDCGWAEDFGGPKMDIAGGARLVEAAVEGFADGNNEGFGAVMSELKGSVDDLFSGAPKGFDVDAPVVDAPKRDIVMSLRSLLFSVTCQVD